MYWSEGGSVNENNHFRLDSQFYLDSAVPNWDWDSRHHRSLFSWLKCSYQLHAHYGNEVALKHSSALRGFKWVIVLYLKPMWNQETEGWKRLSFRLASPEKRHNNEKPPLEEEKKEKIELKSITSDGEANTATKVLEHMEKRLHKTMNGNINAWWLSTDQHGWLLWRWQRREEPVSSQWLHR